ncbi:hypothetical protein [Devosia sp.]|uniref:hypothetical protein n=1 Tax=Devosia sp. TaxID=1871048 RepID=UPI001AD42BF8|nr:hypothetical protein [Devosia sp.]MBN9332617.1 hypothetical protein [Devosia sp.]
MTLASSIAATVICYALLGILLLSLNLTSFWHWWVKAAAIVLILGAVVGSYFAIVGFLGWPSGASLPQRFSLLASRMVEPDKARGDPGHIYLWVEEIDENQIVISPPRAYEVPFRVNLAFEVEKAQEVLDGGGSILGELDTSETEVARDREGSDNTEGIDQAAGGNDGGTATGEGARFDGTSPRPNLTFSDMPALSLPAKPAV